MGGLLTVEALRQLRLTGQDRVLDRLQVVLAAPDIDADVFRAQMNVVGPMEMPLIVLVSPDDRALLVSQRLAGQHERVGALDGRWCTNAASVMIGSLMPAAMSALPGSGRTPDVRSRACG